MKKKILVVIINLIGFSIGFAQEKSKGIKELDEVLITKNKKAIEQKADRTIFDFSSQAHLNSGSVLEGLKKLPGLIVSEVAGMMYQGKQLDVYMDARPLNISSNELNAFLEGMPANAVERIEVITQPGAEFAATSGGAIINIITSKKSKNYLSATYSSGLNFTTYDKLRSRFNNSLLLSAKNKYFGWQLNLGQSYRESNLKSSITKDENDATTNLSQTDADRVTRSNYAKSALTFDFKNDRLLLNYDVNYNNNDAFIEGNGFGFVSSSDVSKTKVLRQDAVATYQKRFNDKNKKLDFKFNFARNDNDFNLQSVILNTAVLDNVALQDFYNFKIDYSQPIKILDQGKFSFGTLYETLFFETKNKGITNLDYQRRTAATYLELQSSWEKFDFIIGGRTEDYAISGKTNTSDLIPFNQFRFFPNASMQYNFGPQIFFSINYNKKISLPSTSSLNPNNTNYQNQNINYSGNPQLEATIFDNYEVKISAFDYAFIGYNVSSARNQVINRVLLNNNLVSNTSINISEIKIHNFNIGLPLPYMLFTKGLKETIKMDFNPDKINFLYLYTGYQKHQIPNLNTNGYWIFNLMSQVLLPKEIKFVTNFNYTTTGGNYYYFKTTKPFSNSLDMSFSKKFLAGQLSVSLNFDDILNTNQQGLTSVGTPVLLENKFDTRRFGFTLNYKIPTKNKLAKEDPNLLNKDKKEENSNTIIN
ncbi:TonB-dependent receptor [Flavobacterium sp. ANB]|uniref:outer membrane beta-barrel family protein n=1 Tax=unclassified Flavobacterium TaxID=196869 RepID=UPI0012B862CE|nr:MULTISPECIES: outer membrane beta-barrel family protein [unclassified Flavobacterium]MBF4519530.1 TonB-dependent receptor [Flavobacterium sp. ANB]MTD72400.1 TonB-dependent receptor [Flavobacterium sp. LC2016-13]